MSILFQHLELETGESILWVKAVGNVQKSRLVGGRLVITDKRIAFRPLQHERLFGAKGWSIPMKKLGFIDVVPPQAIPANLRSLLRLHLRDGHDELFAFNGLWKAMGQLEQFSELSVQPIGGAPIERGSYPVRSGMEKVVPLVTVLALIGTLISPTDWFGWIFVGVGAVLSAGFWRLRNKARKQAPMA